MRILSGQKWTAAIAVLGLAVAAPTAQAGMTYGFTNITSNNATNAAAGTARLRVDVNEVAGNANQVDFTFYILSGPLAMTITDVYFDDGTLLGISQVINMSGVNFTQSTLPGNSDLPGANGIDFHTSAGFYADANNTPNGVQAGEQVTIRFNLSNNQTFTHTIAALQLGLDNPGVDVTGGLRIGIHLQGLPNNGSEAFVNGGPPTPNPNDPVVPAPAGLVLLASAAPFAIALRRRARKTA